MHQKLDDLQRSHRPRVLIVGCGFGGLFAVRALRGAPVDIVIIDRNNYHLFQPLLYQVASAALTPADIAQPIRRILHREDGALVMLGEVQRISLAERCVFVDEGCIRYDYLILAPGSVDNYFGQPNWQRYAAGMKDIEDAVRIRSRVLLSFEAAEIEADLEQRRAHLTFVIVGGGPTGVELAGAIRELAVDVIPHDFRLADTRRARVVLIEAGKRLLPAFHEESSARALAQLRKLGVEVRLGQPVTQVLSDAVEIGNERIRTFNTIWAAGVRASPLVETLGAELGPGRRVKVEPDCSIPAHPESFVIGDAAFLVDPKTRHAVPGVSQGAIQMARFVARVIREDINGRQDARRRGFRYRNRGSMATVGKARAVVEFDHLRFGGFFAWLLWLLVHIAVLIGFRNRIGVMAEWTYNYVFGQRGSRLITGVEPGRIHDWVLVSKDAARRPTDRSSDGQDTEQRLGENARS